MAEDVKADMPDKGEESKGSPIIAYKLVSALGDNPAGSIVHLPEEVGKALVKSGLATLAAEGDVGAESETEETDMPMVTNSIARLGKQVEKAVGDAVAKMSPRHEKPTPPTMPAQVKGPIYRSVGAYAVGCIRAQRGNQTEANKVQAYQEEAATAWKSKGFSEADVKTKAALGINETLNSTGGFLVNPQFSPDVYIQPHNQLDLASLCETVRAEGNIYNQRFIQEQSLANGSIFGGLNMVPTNEGASFTSSLPAWSNLVFQLHKLAIFSYLTTEIIEDASYPLESELNDYATKAFLYGINSQIIQGGTYEGLLNSPSLVTVPHSANDTAYGANAATNLTYSDLANMWAAVYPDCQASPKGIWLMHPSLVASLTQMTYVFGANANSPAWGISYNAEQGLSGVGAMTPYKIFGKPCYSHWACSAPGTVGDILYVDFATCKNFTKPFRVETSTDFQFGSDQTAVRWVNRSDVKTVFRNRVTGPTGGQSFSAIIARSASGS